MTERMEDSLVRIGEAGPRPPTGKLRRELSIWEAVGVSVALMAPSMAANINPQGSAAHGRPRRAAGVRARRRSACCWSPTRSSGCASTSTTRARCTGSSARRSGPRAGVVAGLVADRHLQLLRRGHVDARPGSSAPAFLDDDRHLEQPAAWARVPGRRDRAARRARAGASRRSARGTRSC